MAQEVQLFQKENLGMVRILGDKEKPLFCLKDVCEILGITNNSDVKVSIIKEFGDDLDLIYPITDSLGRQQKATFITEPQLYFILMRSDKPKAKPFRQWVISEVLPAIRKTGSYSIQKPMSQTTELSEQDKLHKAQLLKEFSDLYRDKYDGRYSQILDSYAVKELTGENILPLPERVEKYYTAHEVGDILGVSANRIGRIANQHNLKTDANGSWFIDKAKYSNKEIEAFKYNQTGIDCIKRLL